MDGGDVKAVGGAELKGANFRYYDLVMAAFVAILLLSNVLGAGKRAEIDLPFVGLWPFGAGILFFPLSYLIGDILTEVYGYARARRCIWAGFVATLFMALMSWVVVALPPASNWPGQAPMNRCSARCRGSSSPRLSPSGRASSPTATSWRG
jgi:hypothetical protein